MPSVEKKPSLRSPVRVLATLGALSAAAGCAHTQPRLAAAGKAPAASAVGPATGTWDWVFRANDNDGNLRVEQEEWHLTQSGTALEGFYDRAVTRVSIDDRPFKCNRQLGFTRFTRVRIAGEIAGSRVRIRELDYRTRPDPCDDGARVLVTYEGELSDHTLKLWFADHAGQQILVRRDGEGPVLAQEVGFEEKPRPLPDGVRSKRPVTGVWQWELKSVDAEGDERVEREEWHLEEGEDGITGWYDRRVTRVRGDGVHACNGAAQLETNTRYDIRGHRFGDTVTLTETAFHAEKNPCDNGARRLDVYQGSVSQSGGELILSWPAGNQVLRRKDASPSVSSALPTTLLLAPPAPRAAH